MGARLLFVVALSLSLILPFNAYADDLSSIRSPITLLPPELESSNQYASWSLAHDDQHNWLAAIVYADRGPHGVLAGHARVLVTRSFDRGLTWCAPQPIAQGTDSSPRIYSDVGAHYLGGDDWAITWTSKPLGQLDPEKTVISRSSDAGVTWSKPVTFDSHHFEDAARFGYVRPVVRSSSGTWVTEYENFFGVYDTEFNIIDYDSGPIRVSVARSVDEGATWSNAALIFDHDIDFDGGGDASFTQPVTDGQGTWMVGWSKAGTVHDDGRNFVGVAVSEDDGHTWRAQVVGEWNVPAVGVDLSIDLIRASDTTWILLYTHADATGRFFTRSADNGLTWSAESRLSASRLATGANGRIFAFGTADSQRCTSDFGCLQYTFTEDAGVNWMAPQYLPNFAINEFTPVYDGACGWLLAASSAHRQNIRLQRLEGPPCPPLANGNDNYPCPEGLPQNDNAADNVNQNASDNRNDNAAGNANQNAVPANRNAANTNAGASGNDNSANPSAALCPAASAAALASLITFMLIARKPRVPR